MVFKINQSQNQNRSIDKVQNLGNEKRQICKYTLAKIAVRAIFHIQDHPEKCAGTSGWAPTETSVTELR